MDESFDVCVNGFLVGDLDEDPRPSNCVQGVKDHHHGLRVPIFLFLLDKGVVIRVEDRVLSDLSRFAVLFTDPVAVKVLLVIISPSPTAW